MANGYTCIFVNFEFFSVVSHFLAHIYRSVYIYCLHVLCTLDKKKIIELCSRTIRSTLLRHKYSVCCIQRFMVTFKEKLKKQIGTIISFVSETFKEQMKLKKNVRCQGISNIVPNGKYSNLKVTNNFLRFVCYSFKVLFRYFDFEESHWINTFIT